MSNNRLPKSVVYTPSGPGVPSAWTPDGYRLAGEVFGRLRDAMDFGRVVMGQDDPLGPIVFIFAFQSGKQQHAVIDRVHENLLPALKDLDGFVAKIVARWQQVAKEQRRETDA